MQKYLGICHEVARYIRLWLDKTIRVELNTANGLLASNTVRTKEIWPHIAAHKHIPLQGHGPHRKDLLKVQGDMKAKKKKRNDSPETYRYCESHHRLGYLPLLTTTTSSSYSCCFYCCSCCVRIHNSLSSIFCSRHLYRTGLSLSCPCCWARGERRRASSSSTAISPTHDLIQS